MKIHLPNLPLPVATPMLEAFTIAGIEASQLNDADFVYFGKNRNYKFYSSLPEKFLTNINLDLTVKDKMMDACRNAGINFITSHIIEDRSTITNFPENNVFIKPSEGGNSITPYTFTYKIYNSKTELLSTIDQECPDFFTVDENGFSESKNHIIQKAFLPEEDGFTHQYFVTGLINGQGEIAKDGLGKTHMAFNSLNDEDDISYPNRHIRFGNLRNLEDNTDKYEIFSQLQQLVNFYNIKNTPFNCQFLVDETGKSYLSDLSYVFQRGLHFNENLVSREELADKIKFVYDLQPDIKMPLTGYTCMLDFLIEPDSQLTMEQLITYANSLGFYTTDGWGLSSRNAKSRTFVCRGTTEEDIRNRIEQVKTYIENNKTV
jgi:hypothetical protein